jgi:hypothetical protein
MATGTWTGAAMRSARWITGEVMTKIE